MAGSVLITGASSGIGAATARHLLERGFRVFGTSRDPAQRPSDAPDVHWIAVDVRDEASVREGVRAVVDACDRLDAVVCNAGFGIFGSIEEVALDETRAQFETNVFGTLATLRAVLPTLRSQRHGRVAIVGSLSGRAPIPFQGHYSASKAATEALAFALHNEVAAFGIHVSLIEPGDIRTAFNDATDFRSSEGSAYGDAINRCRSVIETSLPNAPSPEIVARMIHRALTARRPRVRYSVGREAAAVALGRRLLPDRWSLALIRRHFGL